MVPRSKAEKAELDPLRKRKKLDLPLTKCRKESQSPARFKSGRIRRGERGNIKAEGEIGRREREVKRRE